MKKEYNFKNIKCMLSRDEMKAIKGGSGNTLCQNGSTCNGSGKCGSYYKSGVEVCCCSVDKPGVNSSDICSV